MTTANGDKARPEDGADAIFDSTDRSIVECLREDGRMSLAEIGRRTGLVEATVRRRLQRMKDNRLLKIVPVIDPDNVGLETGLLIDVKTERRRLEKVTKAIAALPEVRFVGAVTGPSDLMVEAFVSDREHMGRLVLDSIGGIEGVISTETRAVLRVEKFAYEWEVPEVAKPGSK
ncbi:MAG: AsnC family transcriptional regulator [Gemmatimonas sp.]|nr:AsnC family transcriptional regulator [Gemmatimonas sp.]